MQEEGEDKIIFYVVNFAYIFKEHFVLIIITLTNLQFANLILFLSNLFELANNNLKTYLKSTKAFIKREESTDRARKELTLIDVTDGNLSKLIDFYDEIYDLCKHANKYFGVSLLLSSILTLLTMLVSLYFLVNTDVIQYDFKMFVFQFGYTVLNLWFVLYCCESAVSEV